MVNISNSNQNTVTDTHTGWESIWASGDIPPRYLSFAEPSAAVEAWIETVPAGGYVLDVGCGAGRHVVYLAGRGFRMAGVDVSPSGVRMTREACAARQITPFDGRVSDMTELPWADGTFDAVLSIATIHHHRRANIARALNEVRRVLKPGGLFLVDFPCTEGFIYGQLRRLADAGEILEVEPNTFVDERQPIDDPDAFLPHHFCDEADLHDLLKSFEIVRLWADLHDITLENGEPGKAGKWVAWVRKPDAEQG